MPLADTGIAGLDTILCGGLPRNRIYLIEGDPGVGKTTLALQFLLAGVAKGERVLYVTLSESEQEIKQVAESHGWTLEGVSLFELSALQQQMSLEAQNTVFHPSDVELTETTRAILNYVEKVNPQRVVFDSLSELRLLAQNPLRYRREVLNLKQYFAGKLSTVLLLDDRTSEPGDMQLQSLAHGVISMQQHAIDYGGDRRRIRVAKLRGRKFITGYHDYAVRTGGLEVFPRLVAAAQHEAEYKRDEVSSGIPALDKMLDGGLTRGTSTLILGPAGTGKTAIASAYACAAAMRGERVVMFEFDELRRTTIERADSLGMKFSEAVAAGNLVVQQIDPAEMSPGELVHRARELIENQGFKLIVFDSLNGYLHSMPAEKYLYIQLHELLTYFGQLGATTLMVMAQSGIVGTTVSPADISYIADSVMMLRYFEAAGRVRKAISVIKKRTGKHEDTIRELTLGGKDGITLGEPLRDFRGILTSLPEFFGDRQKLEES
ncbi:MAG TPA: ATPase domain-containing protein [Kofleriaceae bacterium]|nr:ATPase domain-containing protein [Kofleriaceae bacterium]